jgi:orotate phosphoribosyltransferase
MEKACLRGRGWAAPRWLPEGGLDDEVLHRDSVAMDPRQRLKELLVERSVRLGDFTLASGARSSYYVDARRTTMSAEGQVLTGKVCYQALRDTGWEVDWVGGPTMGADPVAYAIAHRSFEEGTPIDAFSVRKEPKGHGTGQQIEGGLPAGARVLVVEDSMTTGGSTLRTLDVLERHGVHVAGVLVVVDRQEGGRERLEDAGYRLVAVFTGPELRQAAGPPGPGAS